MKFLDPEKGNRFKVKIPPGQAYMIVLKLDGAYSYSSTYSESVSIEDESYLLSEAKA